MLVADLLLELGQRCGLVVDDVGLYLDTVQAGSPPVAVTGAFLRGVRLGLKDVGVATSGLVPTDADAANLTSFAAERVLDRAELVALEEVLLKWHRAQERDGLNAREVAPAGQVDVGFREAERRRVADRAAALKEACRAPYREPGPGLVVNAPRQDQGAFPWGGPAYFGPYGR